MKPQGPKGYGVHHYLREPRHFQTLEHRDGHRCITSEAFLRFDDFPLTDLEDIPTDMKSMAFTPYYWMVCGASRIWKFLSQQRSCAKDG